MLSRAEKAMTRFTQGSAAKVMKIGRGEAQEGPKKVPMSVQFD